MGILRPLEDVLAETGIVDRATILRSRYGIPDYLGDVDWETDELRRTAAEGLDPLQFRRRAALMAGGSARKITAETQRGMSAAAPGAATTLLSGGVHRAAAAGAEKKITSFGDIIVALMSEDEAIRNQAKQLLFSFLLSRQQLDQSLILHEEMIKAQLAGD